MTMAQTSLCGSRGASAAQSCQKLHKSRILRVMLGQSVTSPGRPQLAPTGSSCIRLAVSERQCEALQTSDVAKPALPLRPFAMALSLANAVALSTAATAFAADDPSSSNSGGFLAPLSDGLETILKVLQTGLDTYHVPYSYGWSIILLTLGVKIATFPFLKKQTESSLSVQALKPRIDRIKARYGDDKKRVQKETSILYEEAGVNPLAGCLPTLATIPIFIGLYRSLTNVAGEGLLDSEGFYWIPSLAAPTSIAARQAGSGTAWLFPFVDGHPPIGWHDATLYLVLPVLLVACQYASTAYIMPKPDPNDESAKTTQTITKFLPLMIGWFSLNVPSGLTLYYLANTVLTSAIQVYLKKFGGATITLKDLGPVTKLGSGRRLGPEVTNEPWQPPLALAAAAAAAGVDGALPEDAGVAPVAQSSPTPSPAAINRRCKRKKLAAVSSTAAATSSS